jgi:hypothetical protein
MEFAETALGADDSYSRIMRAGVFFALKEWMMYEVWIDVWI